MAEKKPRACRNLMAELSSVDSKDSKENGETSRQELPASDENHALEAIREQSRLASERWNFDFANFEPLEGPWEWIKVPSEDSDNVQANGKLPETENCKNQEPA